MRIRSFVETISLAETANNRMVLESGCFTERESSSSLSLKTLAGLVCIKKAVCAALAERVFGLAALEKEIVLGHDANGAPMIKEMPAAAQRKIRSLCVSLSHTKDLACGCAVIEEEADNA
jgi:phosphopantetheinyl transferase (holo-ACP synthase)